jgi:signal transduction histidine kinase
MKQMLDVARYESGRVAVVREKFDSTEFIRSLRPALSVLARDKKFRLIIGEEAGSLAVKSDKQRVSQVIYDLIDNAVKHSEAKNIALSLSKVGDDEALVEVIDDGCGIPQELQSKLFLKFYQLNPSLSRPQDGIGLGLYSCKLAVDSLGGRIGVKSSSGKGSKFFFTLPLEK